MSRLLLLLLLAQSLFPAKLHAQYQLYSSPTDTKHGSKMEVTAMPSILPASGYLPVRIALRNGDPKNELSWTFHFTSKDNSWNAGNHLNSEFTVSCPANQQRSVELLVPLVTVLQNNSRIALELSISGRPPITANYLSMESDQNQNWPSVLMSETLHTPNSGPLDSSLASRFSYGGPQFAGSFLPQESSDDWRAYEGFDLLMLTDEDWKELSPGARNAILKWNRLGGKIIFYTTDPNLTLTALGFQTTGNDSPTLKRTWGEIRLVNLSAATGYSLDAKSTERLVHSLASQTSALVTGREFARGWPLQRLFGERSFNPILFIVILIIFGIIVGPINLFIFAKTGRRHRLFITTPIISLAASLLLLTIIIFQDGFGGKGHRLTLIEIQPEENTAYLRQQQIARTGVLLKTSFATSNDAILDPLALADSRWTRVTGNRGDARYRLEPGEKNTLAHSGDWFKSRSEYGHQITAVQATRGRLEMLTRDGRPQITSTFNFPLKKVYYVGENGDFWQSSGPVTSGRTVALQPCPESSFTTWLHKTKLLFTNDGKTRLDAVKERREHFLAIAEEGPFIETLSSLNWEQSRAILSGPMVMQ